MVDSLNGWIGGLYVVIILSLKSPCNRFESSCVTAGIISIGEEDVVETDGKSYGNDPLSYVGIHSQ